MDAICTSRLRLRTPSVADAMDLSRMMSASISARLASWPCAMPPGSAQLRIQQAIAAREAGLAIPLAMTRLSDGQVVGWISASRMEAEPRRAVLTYWVGEPYHGQGFMREAGIPALEAVFRLLGVTEVRAAVQADNLASRSVLRGMGMRLLGPGRIWCSARGREEPCEWWSVEQGEVAAQPAAALSFQRPTMPDPVAAAAP
jgi:RimJ/RimL family protein N-acetyltransferase